MRNIFCKITILFGLVLVISCGQDPIFYTISTEPAPVPPLIPGSPTNMVKFNRNNVPIMYVASGSLHWYAKRDGGKGTSGWDSREYNIPQPGGKVIGLAATDKHLYALSISNSGVATVLRRIGPADDKWQEVPIEAGIGYRLIQSIFADSGRLFAGAMNSSGSDFGILYLDDTGSVDDTNPVLRLIISDTEMLSGAASQDGLHYLSTRGKGVYQIAEADISAPVRQLEELVYKKGEDGYVYENAKEANRLFMGMIQLEDGSIIVVERNGGAFFEVQESGIRQLRYSNGDTVATGRYSTGALALWQNVNNEEEKMLIAGIQGGLYSTSTSSSYTHGYAEFDLEYIKSDGWLVFTSTRRNTSPSITVDSNTDRYTATIGKHPINYLYQASREIDANKTFFASTQTAGLWSYRDRDGGLQWNAEN